MFVIFFNIGVKILLVVVVVYEVELFGYEVDLFFCVVLFSFDYGRGFVGGLSVIVEGFGGVVDFVIVDVVV